MFGGLGWLGAFVGLYRIMDDYDGVYRGASDLFETQQSRDLRQYRAWESFKASYGSPRHWLDRLMLWSFSGIFVGSMIVLAVYATVFLRISGT